VLHEGVKTCHVGIVSHEPVAIINPERVDSVGTLGQRSYHVAVCNEGRFVRDRNISCQSIFAHSSDGSRQVGRGHVEGEVATADPCSIECRILKTWG
jgi:hypothetical protein